MRNDTLHKHCNLFKFQLSGVVTLYNNFMYYELMFLAPFGDFVAMSLRPIKVTIYSFR